MRRALLIISLILLFLTFLANGWRLERADHFELKEEVESLRQVAVKVQLEEQADRLRAEDEISRLDAGLAPFAWLVGKWGLVSDRDFRPGLSLPGHPKFVFEHFGVYTACGLSELEIRPSFDGKLRANYSVFFLVESAVAHLPIEETMSWDEDRGLWNVKFAYRCYFTTLKGVVVRDEYSASGEYDLDRADADSWTGTIHYSGSHEQAPKPDSTLVLHRMDEDTMRIELTDRQEDKFKENPVRLRELELTFQRISE